MKVRIFGESHAPEIGVEIDGVPAGTRIDFAVLQAFLDRRAPGNGQGGLSTPRREPDRPEFTSGLSDGVADGSTIRAVIRNTNIRPQDYANVSTVPRPGHADYASWLQCGRIPTGGGKWSGRMTAPLCIAGGIALQLLARRGVSVSSEVSRPSLDGVDPGDSVGGTVRLVVAGFPAGVGDVGAAGLESRLAAALFGVPAVKGVEFGDGFALAGMRGSEANDAFVVEGGRVLTRTNHCGGILGGVSTGMPLVVRIAFKPTPSIAIEQDSVDLATMAPAKIAVKGRHDRCVAYRGAVAAEAAVAIVLDQMLQEAGR
ncbi:MAG: chorismate synthase [Kiritimatiellae bacterium]|nr:chorismate synthase [Kiritimatiellia bacterium]